MIRGFLFLASLLVAVSFALPSAHGAAARQAGPPETLEQVTALAKKEGELVVFGPAGPKLRSALTETFSKRYGVRVEYLPAGGFQVVQRVERERQGGVYAWDIFMSGTTTLVKGLRPIGALEPIEPALMLQEVKDPKNWRGGELPFFDKERIGLSVLRGAGQYFFVNSKLAPPSEFKSWRELANPKWKGKILVGRDPRTSGYGNSTFKFFYTNKSLGTRFIQELVKQDLTMLKDDRMAAQWLGQGKYAICICSDIDTNRLIEQGLPIKAIDGRQLQEGTHVTSAYANVAIANRAPHPNAAKLYANWVLSKEGGTQFSLGSGMPSIRKDVPTEHVLPWTIPEPQWPVSNTEEELEAEEPLIAYLKQLIGE